MIIGISGKIGSGKDTIAKIIQFLDVCNQHNSKLIFSDKFTAYNQSKWEVKRMADKLKDIVCIMTGCTRTALENQSFKDSLLPNEWQVHEVRNEGYGQLMGTYGTKEEAESVVKNASSYTKYSYKQSERTYRWLLQYIGTDLFRDKLHNNVHINMLFSEYKLKSDPSIKWNDGADTNKMYPDYHIYPNWIIPDVRFPNEAEAIKSRKGILLRVNRWREDHFEYNVKEHYSETALDDYVFPFIIKNDSTIEDLVKNVKVFLEFNNLI